MIFSCSGREEGSGLFITFNKDGLWTQPERMGNEINMVGYEFCPIISPDGKYFFFTSFFTKETLASSEELTYKKIVENYNKSNNNPQMGDTDIYWVDAKIIEEYRSKTH